MSMSDEGWRWPLRSASTSQRSPSQRIADPARVSLRTYSEAIPRLAIGSAGTTATRASTHLRAAPFELGEGASGRSKRHHASARSPERSRSSAGRTRHGVTGASLRRRPAHFRNGRRVLHKAFHESLRVARCDGRGRYSERRGRAEGVAGEQMTFGFFDPTLRTDPVRPSGVYATPRRAGAAGVAGRITLAPVGDSRSAAAGADDGRRSSEAATLPAPPLAPARTNKARAAGLRRGA